MLNIKNLDTDQEDVSLSEEENADDYDGDDDADLELESYLGVVSAKSSRQTTTSKLRLYSSSSTDTSNASSSSSKSNGYMRRQIKKLKKRETLRKAAPVKLLKTPDHLTDYQYFEKDDDDTCLFDVKTEAGHVNNSKAPKNKTTSDGENDENADGDESSPCSSLSLDNFDTSSSSNLDDTDENTGYDTDDSNNSSDTNSSASSSSSSSTSSSNNSSRVLHKPPPPLFIRQQESCSLLTRSYFSNLTNKYAKLPEMANNVAPVGSSASKENLTEVIENGAEIMDHDLILDKVVHKPPVEDCIQIEKNDIVNGDDQHHTHFSVRKEDGYDDDDDCMNEKCFDNFYSVSTYTETFDCYDSMSGQEPHSNSHPNEVVCIYLEFFFITKVSVR